MNATLDLSAVAAELDAGMALAKCQQCGCMHGALDEIAAFRRQVAVVDLIGCEDPAEIAARVTALAETAAPTPCGCGDGTEAAGELAKAELSLQYGFRYLQDGA